MKTGIAFDAEAIFAEEFSAAIAAEVSKSGFPVDDWFWSGRQKPDNSVLWWEENGPALVHKYIDWYESHEDVKIWVTPDGQPAIELKLRVKFGETEVAMAIDQVLVIGTALVVTDLKTSAKAPESPRQLGIYACGIELAYGVRPKYGAYFLPRDEVPFQRPVELSGRQYSIGYFTREFALAEKVRKDGIFLANPGRACGRCGVAYACLAAGGASAREHDPAHPHYGRKLSSVAPR